MRFRCIRKIELVAVWKIGSVIYFYFCISNIHDISSRFMLPKYLTFFVMYNEGGREHRFIIIVWWCHCFIALLHKSIIAISLSVQCAIIMTPSRYWHQTIASQTAMAQWCNIELSINIRVPQIVHIHGPCNFFFQITACTKESVAQKGSATGIKCM